MSDAHEIAAVLDQAADVIAERGWWDSGYIPPGADVDLDTCPVCALAAINVAVGMEPDEHWDADHPSPLARVAGARLAVHLGVIGLASTPAPARLAATVGEWNDQAAIGATQVIRELRACAATLRGGA